MTSLIMAHISHISNMLLLKTTFKAMISCACCIFLHQCNVSYFLVGVYISQPLARPFCHFGLFLSKWRLRWLVWIFEKRSWTEADRTGHSGQREGFKAKEDLKLHGEQDRHIQTGENIVLLSNKATYSGGDDEEGIGGGSILDQRKAHGYH